MHVEWLEMVFMGIYIPGHVKREGAEYQGSINGKRSDAALYGFVLSAVLHGYLDEVSRLLETRRDRLEKTSRWRKRAIHWYAYGSPQRWPLQMSLDISTSSRAGRKPRSSKLS